MLLVFLKQSDFSYCHLNETGSTNSDLYAWLKSHSCCAPLVLHADRQNAGRGTQGRQWDNSKQSLLFTLSYPLKKALHFYQGISLVVGLSVVQMLRDSTIDAWLKWPNDVYVNNKKLAGILIETVKDPLGQHHLLIGIGLNLQQEHNQERSAISDVLSVQWNQVITKEWLDSIVQSVLKNLEHFEQVGFSFVQNQWANYALYLNEEVNVLINNETLVQGVMRGVDETGRLLVVTSGGIQSFLSGTVSLRKSESDSIG